MMLFARLFQEVADSQNITCNMCGRDGEGVAQGNGNFFMIQPPKICVMKWNGSNESLKPTYFPKIHSVQINQLPVCNFSEADVYDMCLQKEPQEYVHATV